MNITIHSLARKLMRTIYKFPVPLILWIQEQSRAEGR